MKKTFKFLTVFLLALLGANLQPAWADDWTQNYVAMTASNPNNYTAGLSANRGDNTGGDQWENENLSSSGITFNGKKLYEGSFWDRWQGLQDLYFKLKQGDTEKTSKNSINGWTAVGDIKHRVYNLDDGSWYSPMTMGKSKVYFNASNWTSTTIKLVVAHAHYAAYYQLSQITNTKLYYGNPDLSGWKDAMGIGVVGNSSAAGGNYQFSDIPNNAAEYTGLKYYQLNNNGDKIMYFITPAGKGENPSCDYSADYTTLNKTQTVKVMVKKAGASNYTEETTFANWPGTIKAKRYRLNTNGASSATETNQDITSTATFTSVITSEATLTATANSGYAFRGFNTTNSVPGSVTNPYSYTVSDETTTYAFFEEVTYSVTFGVGTDYTSFGSVKASVNGDADKTPGTYDIGASSKIIFTATPNTGYHVAGWYSDAACSSAIAGAGTGTSYTIESLSKAETVYVKFVANTFSVKFNGNGSTSGSMTDQAFTYDAAQNLTVNAFKRTGYTFQGWAKTANGAVEFTDQQSVSNLTTTNGGTVNLYAVWQEKIYSGITVVSNNTDKGTVDVSTATFGYTTGQQIIASHKAGYYLKDWTLPANATITSTESTATTTTITVKASGDADVTGKITANFAERWVLRGSRSDGSGDEGMPGFSTTTDVFTFAADATTGTKTVTLLPNREYKFMVYDRKAGEQRGYKNENQTLGANVPSGSLDGSFHILMNTAGYGIYTFTVQENNTREYPRIEITNPASYQITMGTKFTTEGCGTGLNGGTLTAKTTENEQDFTVTTGNYVRKDGQVVFTATPKTGYLFEGFYSDKDCAEEHLLQAASAGLTYTIDNIQSAKSVYAKFSEILKEVTVIQGDGSQSTVKVGVASHPEITATAVSGKKFTGWSTNHVTVANANSKTTTITGYSDGYNAYSVTATWGDLDAIYFDVSNSNWNPSCMYVYFYYHGDYWKDDYGVGTNTGGAYSGTHLEMQKVDPNNNKFWVVYFDPSTIGTGLQYITRIAFADQNKPNNDTGCQRANKEYFHDCTVSYFDYNQCMNMCVLLNDNGKEPNKRKSGADNRDEYLAWYRNEGFWKSYNQPSSKLSVNLYDGGSQKSSTALDYNEGDGWYSGSVHMDVTSGLESYKYYFIIGGCDGNNWSSNGWEIKAGTAATEGNVYPFYKNADVYGQKVIIYATTTGSYKFYVKHNNNNELSIKVEYPVYKNDYRVVSVIDDEVHDNGYLYKPSTIGEEMASFYVVNGAVVKLQKCTAITGTTVTWSDVAGQSFTITGLSKPSVYNFKITHNGADATLSQVGEYTGNFYIRTDKLNGGWTDYMTNSDNLLTHYGDMVDAGGNYQFNYYQTKFISGDNKNVKCVVANDYSKCISDTLVGDNMIGGIDKQELPQEANVRFMWNSQTNVLKRAYLSGSAKISDRYLVLNGNKDGSSNSLMLDSKGEPFTAHDGLENDEAIFTDMGNWVYQIQIKAKPGCAVKLMADYNNQTQYFIGAAGEEADARKKIMDGTGSNAYSMRAVYDFKNNQLVAGWIPDNETEIDTEIKLGGDMLLVRQQQNQASQIRFGSAADAKVSSIKQIYGVLELNKEDMTNRKVNGQRVPLTNNSYDRCMYWISFPFRVQLSKVFGGVGGYGTKWIMQQYRGDLRAQEGLFKNANFWEYMDENDYMEPYVGYVLSLNPSYFDEPSDEVWQNVETSVAFYFPSEDKDIDIISSASKTVNVPAHPCGINVNFEYEGKMQNHQITDSHWNVIGIPAFEDLKEDVGEGRKIGLNALYEWNSTTNLYAPVATATGYTFNAMKAYMVQFSGEIDWSNASVITKAFAAPRYAFADYENYMIELFFNGNGAEDHTYINLADGASTDFVLNEDMMKIDNAGFPNIYSFAGAYDVAYNETKMENQSVMLGVSAPKDGSYTFAMPKDFSGKAVLVDLESGEATDLNLSDYTVDLDKGTYNNRFQLLLEVEAKAPTAIDNANGEWSVDGKTKKLLINDNIYLINGGRIYNVLGVGE